MKTADFDFLRRKELLIFCIFLVVIAFSQIALERLPIIIYQSSRASYVVPFLELDNRLLESLGVFLPVFTGFFIFFQSRRSKEGDYSWIPPRKFLIGFSLILLFIIFFPIPEPPEEEPVVNGPTNTTQIPNPVTSTTTNPLPDTSTPSSSGGQIIDSGILSAFLTGFRNVFIIGILFFPLLFIFIFQKKYRSEEKQLDQLEEEITDEIQAAKFMIRSILECYHQASIALEERGADDAPNLTPSEFNNDVLEKNLSKPKLITTLTNLFEEAKFSTHDMSNKEVDHAKSIASEILYESKQIFDLDQETTESVKEEESSESRKKRVDNN
ncbi:MAG: DUF4129 domain-containing protein [Candidatus Hodarchaeota archaeon]